MYPSKTVLAMPHITCSGNFLWVRLDGLSPCLEVFNAYNIIFWLNEHLWFYLLCLEYCIMMIQESCIHWTVGILQPEMLPVLDCYAPLEEDLEPLDLVRPYVPLKMLQQWVWLQKLWLFLLLLWKCMIASPKLSFGSNFVQDILGTLFLGYSVVSPPHLLVSLWAEVGIRFLKNCVENPLLLCLISSNFESLEMLHGSHCVPSMNFMHAIWWSLRWFLVK